MTQHRHASIALCLLAMPAFAQLPDGYVEEIFVDGLTNPVGVTFDGNAHAYVWTKAGIVFLVESGELVRPPLLDLSEEVGNWRDFGMLGFALDPEFTTNGDFYCYYVVDRHHLIYHGTPQYDAETNWYREATIGRVTRFTADSANDFKTVVPGSRTVLLGETIDSGIPILYESHGTGSVIFGSDGSLLVSSGDGASYNTVDHGSLGHTYWQTALDDGIIRAAENVGAFRSQMIGSLSGKILRLDPVTGDGLPSNPFFDPAAPRSPQSRVWALGLRNPFRMSVRPGTGHAGPAFGDPGVLYIGDVGWDRWEELHILADSGKNLGWPLFGSLTRDFRYSHTPTPNRDAPNPLYGEGSCDEPFLAFHDLLRQEREDHEASFPNPCDPSIEIPASTPTFMHHRAALDWSHNSVTARVPIFIDGEAQRATLGEADSPVAGESFRGFCSVAGTWLGASGFGSFGNAYLLMDFSANWIRALRFDDQDELQEVIDIGHISSPVFAAQDPADGSVLYVSIGTNSVRRLRYTGAGNVAPQGNLLATGEPGTSPLTIRFDGSESFDPEGLPLSFEWDFGDGQTSTAPSPEHAFRSSTDTPTTQNVTLTVSDPEGQTGTCEFTVHLNNTGPKVVITSFENGAIYSTSEPTEIALEALAFDAESPPEALSYAWRLFLHHDNHEHPEAVDTSPSTSVTLTPTPCDTSFYAYRVELTVTDPQGMATTVNHWLLPGCLAGTVQVRTSAKHPRLAPGIELTLEAALQTGATRTDFYIDGARVGTSFETPHRVAWIPPRAATFVASAIAHTAAGEATSAGTVIKVRAPRRVEVHIDGSGNDAEEAPDGKVSLRELTLPLGQVSTIGLRFPLNVPHGARILGAHLEWTSVEAGAELSNLTLRAEATDSAAPILALTHNLTERSMTSSMVTWELEPWFYAFASGARQRTPDLSEVLQELIDRPGFVSGNDALFLVTGSGAREAYSFDPANRNRATRLIVEYVDARAQQSVLDGNR